MPLRQRQPRRFPCDGRFVQGRRHRQLQTVSLQAGRGALHPHRTRPAARDVPRERRHGGHHGRLRRVRQPVLPRNVLRQRDRGDLDHRPRHGRPYPDDRHADDLPRTALRHHEGAHQCRRAADLPRSGQTDRVFRARRAADGGAAHQAARGVRSGDDQGAGLLPGHRKLLALLRRPCRRNAPFLPARLLSEGLPAAH